MIINDKIVIVYDIEVFPNVFSCTTKNTENGLLEVYEISNRKNDVYELIELFKSGHLMCGYNNHHYDDAIMNFILMYEKAMCSTNPMKICRNIAKLSNIIITSGDDTSQWKEYKYAHLFESFDLLTMLFSSKLRVGLKEMQVTMQYHNVQEYEGNFENWLPDNEIDKMIAYNINDVESTCELLNRCKKDIDLRLGIEKEYGISALSLDGVSIGKEVLKKEYLINTGKTWNDIKDLRSPCNIVELNKVILPVIEYKTPILQDLLKEMKSLKVSPGIKGWNKQFLFYDTVISIGVGGLHSVNKPEIIVPKEDEVLLDADAASLYPSLLISWEFYPKHLGKEFLITYSNIKKERIEAKHNGNKVKNETLKLTLNSVTGLMQNEYSWLYSPEDVMKIRMNGQLFLLMLAERLILATGCRIIQYNTDGIFILLKKDKMDEYHKVISEFEKLSRLQFEDEEYERFYQFAINDYIAVGKGYSESKDKKLVKQKGLFIDKVSLGKGMQPMVIPKALNQYFVDGIPVEKTIKEDTDINDFITYQKVDKKFSVEYNNQLITRINRYYVSTGKNSYYLYKCVVDDNGNKSQYTSLLKKSGVTIVNNMNELKEFPKNINYEYYISEAKKIISLFENKQLTLF